MPVTLLDTPMLLQSLVERHRKLVTEVKQVRNEQTALIGPSSSAQSSNMLAVVTGTTALAPVSYRTHLNPLLRKLESMGLKVRVDKNDQGLPLDELKAAGLLAASGAAFKPHLDHIRHAYKQGWGTANLMLTLNDVQDRTMLTRLAFELYMAGFFLSLNSDLRKNTLSVELNPDQKARKFFEGDWLEYWLYFHLAKMCQVENLLFLTLRGLIIEGPSRKPVKLDLACLVNNTTLISIACCTRDHRTESDRLRELHNLLAKPDTHFLICEPMSDIVRASELTTLYKLPFLNLESTIMRLQELLTNVKNPPAPQLTAPEQKKAKPRFRY
jgi:hypothetical protein